MFVHAKDKAAIHHDTVVVQAANGFAVIAMEILEFALFAQTGLVGGFESNKEAA